MDISELKAKYQVGSPPEKPKEENQKFGKRRAWLDNPEQHQSNTNPINKKTDSEEIVEFGKRRTWLEEEQTKKSEQHQLDTTKTPIQHQTNSVEMVFENPFIGVEVVSKQPGNGVESELKKNIGVEVVSKKALEQGLNTIPATPIEHQLDTIVGRERDFLFFVAKQCQKNGSLNTPPLTIEKIKVVLSCSNDSIKTVVYRITNKGLVKRASNKKGRAGWVSYSLEKAIYDQILKQEDFNNGVEIVSKRALEQGLIALSSNSSLNLKETINTEQPEVQFNIPENLKALGIGNRNLAVIVREGILRAEEIQQSLDHYAHDLEKVQGTKKNLNFFFGILRNKTPYMSSTYTQAETKAIREEIARIKELQEKRDELRELKLKEEYEQFVASNPDFLNELKNENQFLAKAPKGLLEKMAFEKWKEKL